VEHNDADTMLLDRETVAGDSNDALTRLLEEDRHILDAILAGIVVADLDFTIRFINAHGLKTMHQIERSLNEVFGISADQIIGGSIHRFHKDPARIERILRNEDGFRFPHEATFSFGEVTLRTNITEMTDRDGDRIGYVVTYEDVSDLAQAEAKTEQLKSELGSASSAIQQLSLSITEISDSAGQASGLASETERNAVHIGAEMADLDSRRSEIDKSLKSIDEVANQTRMLALNATIEAARAGELGKGFAVVAEEVKDLAARTAEVTTDIEARLSENGEAIQRLRAEAEQMAEQMQDINAMQTTIASAVEQQQATAADLASNIANVSDNL
jgi:PAS domain S-box-containing protein